MAVGAGVKLGVGVVSLELAGAAGAEPEALAPLVAGTDEPPLLLLLLPLLVLLLLGFELPELLLCGAACEDEFPSVEPDF